MDFLSGPAAVIAAVSTACLSTFLILTSKDSRAPQFPLYRDLGLAFVVLGALAAGLCSTFTHSPQAMITAAFGAWFSLLALFYFSPGVALLLGALYLPAALFLVDAPASLVASVSATLVAGFLYLLCAHRLLGNSFPAKVGAVLVLMPALLLSVDDYAVVGGIAAASLLLALLSSSRLATRVPVPGVAAAAFLCWLLLRQNAIQNQHMGIVAIAAAALLLTRALNARLVNASTAPFRSLEILVTSAAVMQCVLLCGYHELLLNAPTAASKLSFLMGTAHPTPLQLLMANALGAVVGAGGFMFVQSLDLCWEPVTSTQWRLMTLDSVLLVTYLSTPVAFLAYWFMPYSELLAVLVSGVHAAAALLPAPAVDALSASPYAYCTLTGTILLSFLALAMLRELMEGSMGLGPWLAPLHVVGQQELLAARKGVVALVFERVSDCPATRRLLDTLKTLDVKATLFFDADAAHAAVELAKEAAAEGHQVAIHASRSATSLERFLGACSVSSAAALEPIAAMLESETGSKVNWCMPPHGQFAAPFLLSLGGAPRSWQVCAWTVRPVEELAALGKLPSDLQAATKAVVNRTTSSLIALGGEIVCLDASSPIVPTVTAALVEELRGRRQRHLAPLRDVCSEDKLEVSFEERPDGE